MLLGAGTRDAAGHKRGCVMRYAAPALEGPWKYRGIVAGEAKASTPPRLGRVWECPAILQIPAHSFDATGTAGAASAAAQATNGDSGAAGAPPRDFVPAAGALAPGSAGAASLLVFGAYTSTEQQEVKHPWAWDPVMYYVGKFDGDKMDLDGLQAQQYDPLAPLL